MSSTNSVKGKDCVDAKESPAYKKFIHVMLRHLHITRRALPLWLEDYWVVRLVGVDTSSDVCHVVHSLYHSLLSIWVVNQCCLH
jgi:hypothetical protein